MSDYLWRCQRPGCEYTARGGAATNFAMVMSYHEAAVHPDEPAYSDEVKAFEPWVEEINEFPADRGFHPEDPSWFRSWDDPPPDPDRPFDSETVHEWYLQRIAETPPLTEEELADDPVRYATWLYPAVMAALAAGVVYLSYRAARR